MSDAIIGKVSRISGPIIYAEGMSLAGLYDVVAIGKNKLTGEIIRLKKGVATNHAIQ